MPHQISDLYLVNPTQPAAQPASSNGHKPASPAQPRADRVICGGFPSCNLWGREGTDHTRCRGQLPQHVEPPNSHQPHERKAARRLKISVLDRPRDRGSFSLTEESGSYRVK